METKKITHPLLDPIEYYFCQFNSESDAKKFKDACSWFDYEDITMNYPERCIIKHDKENGWCEKLSAMYFKDSIRRELEIKSAVMNEAVGFFGR